MMAYLDLLVWPQACQASRVSGCANTPPSVLKKFGFVPPLARRECRGARHAIAGRLTCYFCAKPGNSRPVGAGVVASRARMPSSPINSV